MSYGNFCPGAGLVEINERMSELLNNQMYRIKYRFWGSFKLS